MSKSYGIIYKATNTINGKCYIGQTIKTLKNRISKHYAYVAKGSGSYFHNALRKYEKSAFIWEIICKCDDVLLSIQETMKIIVNHSHISEGGYNLTWGGEGWTKGYKHVLTDEEKERRSIRSKGKNNPMYGKNHTDEAKKSISMKNSGRIETEECKDKRAIVVKRDFDFYYVFMSPHGDEYTPINIRRFCRDNDLSIGCIKHVCAGRNKSHKGWSVKKMER